MDLICDNENNKETGSDSQIYRRVEVRDEYYEVIE